MRSWSIPHLRKEYTRFIVGVKWQILAMAIAAALLAPLAAGGWLTFREAALILVAIAAVIAPG